ncbi:MAG TPA: hypothetical protein VK638_04300 [Edaphobacter sp.]|nr:hypothetical protein [Edaphobacter sp.]
MTMELADAARNGNGSEKDTLYCRAVAGGALKLKNDLKFSFEIVARKQG